MQLYFNTFIYTDADIYAEAERDGHLVVGADGLPWLTTGAKFSDTGFADLTRPETRTWVKTFLRRLIDDGALGWMADFAEWMPVEGVALNGRGDPALVHNQYPRLWQQVNEEAMQESGKIRIRPRIRIRARTASAPAPEAQKRSPQATQSARRRVPRPA